MKRKKDLEKGQLTVIFIKFLNTNLFDCGVKIIVFAEAVKSCFRISVEKIDRLARSRYLIRRDGYGPWSGPT